MKLTVEKGMDTLSGGGDQDCVSFPSMFPPSTIFLTFWLMLCSQMPGFFGPKSL